MPIVGRRHAAASSMTKDPAGQFRIVLVVWALIAVSLGALAPKVETALAGAGWEASGSQSVQACKAVQAEFGRMSSAALQAVVHSASGPVTSGGQAITAAVSLLKADKRVSQPGVSISRDGQTAVVQAGAGSANINEMVRAADDLKGPLRALGGKGISSTRPTPTSRLRRRPMTWRATSSPARLPRWCTTRCSPRS